MNTTLATAGHLPTPVASLVPDMHQQLNLTAVNNSYLPHWQPGGSLAPEPQQRAELASAASKTLTAIHLNELQYGAKSQHKPETSPGPMMITKSGEGYYVFNNITLKVR